MNNDRRRTASGASTLLLLGTGLALTACSGWRDQAATLGLTDAEQSSVAASVVCDVTSTACTETTLRAVLADRMRYLARRSGRLRLLVLDANGSHQVATFIIPTPAAAKATRARDEQAVIAEAARYFGQSTKLVFTTIPGSSPIAAAIGTAAVDLKQEAGQREITILTDGREVSHGENLEQQLPTTARWHEHLDSIGFRPDTLKDISVRMLGVDMISPNDRNPSFDRGIRIRDLWTAGLKRAGATNVAFTNVDDLSLAWLVVLAPFAHGLRRLRVWLAGRRDSSTGYDPESAIASHLGPMPLPDLEDPEYLDALHTVEEQRAIIAGLKDTLRIQSRELARRVAWWPNVIGVNVAFLGDATATNLLFKDLGVAASMRLPLTIAFVSSLFVIALIATQKARDGRPPWWWYVLMLFAIGLCVALVIIRVNTATSTGMNSIAEAIVYLGATIGPMLLAEFFLTRLRPVMPLRKEYWAIKRQLRQATKTYQRAVRYLTARAKHRQAWQWEEKVLRAVYNRAYRNNGGPWPPATTGTMPIPINEATRPNGRTIWPA